MQRAPALALGGLLLAALPASAQDVAVEREATLFPDFPRLTAQVHAGGSGFGRFLLQAPTVDEVADQRELTGDPGFSFGGALGLAVLPRTDLRLGFTRAMTDLEFEDDRGTDSSALEQDDLADLSSNVFSLQVLRELGPEHIMVNPYFGLGPAVGVWHLGDDGRDGIRAGGDGDSYGRFGGVATAGVGVEPMTGVGVRGEVATFSLGNPFTGERSLLADGDFTLDEPKRVTQVDLRIALTYTFGAGDEPVLQPVTGEAEAERDETAAVAPR